MDRCSWFLFPSGCEVFRAGYYQDLHGYMYEKLMHTGNARYVND